MVINIIAANVAKETTQYKTVTFTPTNMRISMNREISIAPKNNPIAAIAKPLSRDLDKKAINDIKANINDVMPNVMPNKYQGINMQSDDKAIPINTA